jgi:hypothetical protein
MDDPASLPAPPDDDHVFELLESTRRYLLTSEQGARDLFQTLRSEDRRERIVPSVLFWAAILGGIAWVCARVVLGLGYLSTVRPFRSSGQWLLWAQAAETITFAVFVGASVLYVVLWISRRAPS